MHRLLVLLFATFKKAIHGNKNVGKDERSIATEQELRILYAASTLKQLVALQWVRELLRKTSKIQEDDRVSRTLLVRMDDQLSAMMEHFAASQRIAFTPMPFPCEFVGEEKEGRCAYTIIDLRSCLLMIKNRRTGCKICCLLIYNDIAFCVRSVTWDRDTCRSLRCKFQKLQIKSFSPPHSSHGQ